MDQLPRTEMLTNLIWSVRGRLGAKALAVPTSARGRAADQPPFERCKKCVCVNLVERFWKCCKTRFSCTYLLANAKNELSKWWATNPRLTPAPQLSPVSNKRLL